MGAGLAVRPPCRLGAARHGERRRHRGRRLARHRASGDDPGRADPRPPLRPARPRDGRADAARRDRQGRPALAGGDAVAGRHRPRQVPGAAVVGGPVRVPRRGRPPRDAGDHAVPGATDRHPVVAPDRGRHRVRRPRRASHPLLRRPRWRPAPAAPPEPRRGRLGPGAHEPAAAGHHPARGTQLHRRRVGGDVGGLVVPGRLRRPRGPRAAPARLRGRRARATDHPSCLDLRDGRAVRRPARDALLDQLLRRGRVRAGSPRHEPRARLRLPRRDPLLRRRVRRRAWRARRDAEGGVHPRGRRRRPLEAPGLLQRHERGAPLAPARRVLLGRRRELRLRLLLVPVPGRHHRARRQADRPPLRRRHPRGRRPRRARSRRRWPRRTTSTCSTCAST